MNPEERKAILRWAFGDERNFGAVGRGIEFLLILAVAALGAACITHQILVFERAIS